MTIGKSLNLDKAMSMEEVMKSAAAKAEERRRGGPPVNIPNIKRNPVDVVEEKSGGTPSPDSEEGIVIPEMKREKTKKREEVWVMDPLEFLTEENIEKVGINDEDKQKLFFGEEVEKQIKLSDQIFFSFRTLTKEETDEIENKALDKDDEKTLKIFKEVEIDTLVKSIVSINGKKLGDTDEEKMEKIVKLPNAVFRMLWAWQGVFDKAIELAITGRDLIKKA